jgi:hypothetical protein
MGSLACQGVFIEALLGRPWLIAAFSYKAALQVTETAGRRYLDKSWRE